MAPKIGDVRTVALYTTLHADVGYKLRPELPDRPPARPACGWLAALLLPGSIDPWRSRRHHAARVARGRRAVDRNIRIQWAHTSCVWRLFDAEPTTLLCRGNGSRICRIRSFTSRMVRDQRVAGLRCPPDSGRRPHRLRNVYRSHGVWAGRHQMANRRRDPGRSHNHRGHGHAYPGRWFALCQAGGYLGRRETGERDTRRRRRPTGRPAGFLSRPGEPDHSNDSSAGHAPSLTETAMRALFRPAPLKE